MAAPAVVVVSVSANTSVNVPLSRENCTFTGGAGGALVLAPGVGTPMNCARLGSPPRMPYDTSPSCGGYGLNSCTTSGPGPNSPRYPPPLFNRKFVCNGAAGFTRFFPDAHTIRYAPGARLTLGKDHFVGSFASSVRKKPSRFTAPAVGFNSSIQSENCPSSSASVD